MSSSFICVAADATIRISSLYKAEQCSSDYMYDILFIHPSAERHLTSVFLWANTSTNIIHAWKYTEFPAFSSFGGTQPNTGID